MKTIFLSGKRLRLLGLMMACLLLIPAAAAYGQEPQLDSLIYDGTVRYHYVFIPQTLKPERPLVMMLHGYGGSAKGYCPEMLACAAREGFAVCIPQGLKDPKGGTGWYAGYPSQEGMRQDDDAFICLLAQQVAYKHGLKNLFLTGMSNGGEMCYIIGRKYPKNFNAIASVAGLTMQWVAKTVAFHGPVPFMEIHGTGDDISSWDGDADGKGGWGAYIPVEKAVEAVVRANRCGPCESETLPLYREGARQVTLHRWQNGLPPWKGAPASEVWLYEVEGGTHSWALDDMDSCTAILQFFSKWMKE